MAVNPSFGSFITQLRMSTGLTLREFCIEYDLDPFLLSKLERGIVPPSHIDEENLKFATALGLKEGSDLWVEFLNMASLSTQPVEDAVSEDERVIQESPLFIDCDIGPELTETETDAFIETIRKELRVDSPSS